MVDSEELKEVPAKLEAHIREKHFLAAVTLLVSASKTITKPEMASVGALSDLSRFFNEQLEVRGRRIGAKWGSFFMSNSRLLECTNKCCLLTSLPLVFGRNSYGGAS